MDVKLLIVDGEGAGREITLSLPAVIGRSRSVGITIAHPLVSRQHCELVERDGQLIVRDLGSLNGTFIGDMRVTEEALPPGGLLTVGQVTFQAIYGGFSPDGDANQEQPHDFFVISKSKETATIGETIEEDEPADSKTPTPQSLAAGAVKAAASDEIEEAQVADAPQEPKSDAAASGNSTSDFDFGNFSEQPQEVTSEDEDLNDFLKNIG